MNKNFMIQNPEAFEINTIADISPKILHVDDEQNFIELFKIIFSQYFDITSVESSSTALELLKKNDFDLVITDFEMPGMNGLTLLKEIKRRFPGIPVIFYTAQGSEEVAREAFLSGASDYFVKNPGEFAHKDKLINSVKKSIKNSLAEAALRESEEKYRSIFNLANDCIFLHDAETGEVIDINEKVLQTYGYSADESVIFNLKDIMVDEPEFCYEKALEIIARTIKGESQVFEWKAKNRQGDILWEEVNLKKVKIGRDERLISIVRNIDQRKSMEIKLLQSEARYRSLFSHIADGFVYLKISETDECGIPTDYRIIDMNESYIELTGQTRESLLSFRFSAMLEYMDEPVEKWLDIMRRVVVCGEEIRMNYEVDHLKKSIDLIIYSPEKEHIAIIFKNIHSTI
jgi:PAS domain S-box-containing protein